MTGITLTAVFRCELRLLTRDLACWLTLAVLAVLAVYAVCSGQRLAEERAWAASSLHADERARVEGLRAYLAKIEAGTAAAPERPFRDPRNPMSVGNIAAATAAPADSPLFFVAAGVADLYPPAFKVGIGSADTFLFADEIANPLHLVTGRFDLAFVLTAVLPLCIIALCFNVVSAEREQGTLALTLASPVAARSVFLIKLAVRALAPVAVALIVTLGGVVWLGGEPSPNTWAWLAAAIVLYALFWVALAAIVNGLGRDSAFNALALFAAWAVFLLIVPALVNATTQLVYPLPSRSELVLAARTAVIETDRGRDAEQARYREEHGRVDASAFARERAARRLQANLAANAQVEDILARQDAATGRQHDLASALALFSPAMLMHEILADFSGTGPRRMAARVASVKALHGQWRAFFIGRAEAGEILRLGDYSAFPVYRPTSSDAASTTVPAAAPWVALLAAVAAFSLVVFRVWRRLSC